MKSNPTSLGTRNGIFPHDFNRCVALQEIFTTELANNHALQDSFHQRNRLHCAPATAARVETLA
jgi:hypothetical protein